MDPQTFLLYMNIGRIILMIGSICWLIFTAETVSRVRRVMLIVCMVMLASNLLNATIAIAVLHVRILP